MNDERQGRLQRRIPVETLDDERLTNIERSLVVRAAELRPAAPRTSRRFVALAAAFAACGVAAGLGWKLHRVPAAPVVAVAPAPQLMQVDTTGEHQTLTLGDAVIVAGSATHLEVGRSEHEIVITMTKGTIDLAVAHRADRRLVVRAGDTDIEDLGTKFSVRYDGAHAVDVRVTEGEVSVMRAQKVVRVAAGKEWTTDEGLIALREVVGEAASGSGAGSGAGSGGVVVAVQDAPAILHDRHAAVPDAQREHARRPAVGEERPVLGEPVRREAHAPVAEDPYVDLKVAIRKQPIAFDPRIDGKSDAAAEIARLKKIAYSPTTLGAEPAAALYRMAVLLHRPLGQDTEAIHTLEMYLRRFPSGKERPAALWLRLRILCGHTLGDECRKAAYSYQHEVPTGDAADVAIRITNSQ